MTDRHYALDAVFSYTLDEREDSIVEFLDTVTDHLENKLGVVDLMLMLDEDAKTFVVSQLVPSRDGDSIETVVGTGMGALRTAFHTCNGMTPGWPTPREALLSVSVSQVEVGEQAAKPDRALQPA